MQIAARQSQSWLQLVWRRVRTVHPVYIGLAFIVFAPLFDALSNHAGSDDADTNLELRLHQQFQDRIASTDSVLADFTTDGCSGGMPCTGLAWRWGYGWPSCDQPESE